MKQKQKHPKRDPLIISTMPPDEQMELAKVIVHTLSEDIKEKKYDFAIISLQTGITLISDDNAYNYILTHAVKLLTHMGSLLVKCANEAKDIDTKLKLLKTCGATYKISVRYYADLDNFHCGAICHLNLLTIYDQMIPLCSREDSEKYRNKLLDEGTPVLRYFTATNNTANKDKVTSLMMKYSNKEDAAPIKVNITEVLANGREILRRCHADRTSVSTEELQECRVALQNAVDAVEGPDAQDLLQSCCYQLVKINYTLAYRLDSKQNGYNYLNMTLALMRYVNFGEDKRTEELYDATCNQMCGHVFFQRNNNRQLSRSHFAKAYPIFMRYNLQQQVHEIKSLFPDIEDTAQKLKL